jgi:hypothetical protein
MYIHVSICIWYWFWVLQSGDLEITWRSPDGVIWHTWRQAHLAHLAASSPGPPGACLTWRSPGAKVPWLAWHKAHLEATLLPGELPGAT